jgi:hypothetical protein
VEMMGLEPTVIGAGRRLCGVVRSCPLVPVRTATNGTVDQQTKDYLDRRIREGKSKKEAIRCLKRYVAREVFAALQP